MDTKLQENPSSQTQGDILPPVPIPHKKTWIVWVIIAVAAVLALVFWVFLRNKPNSTSNKSQENAPGTFSTEPTAQQAMQLLIARSSLSIPASTGEKKLQKSDLNADLAVILPEDATEFDIKKQSYEQGLEGTSLGFVAPKKPYDLYQLFRSALEKGGWKITYGARAMENIVIEAEKNQTKLRITGQPIGEGSAKIYAQTYNVK